MKRLLAAMPGDHAYLTLDQTCHTDRFHLVLVGGATDAVSLPLGFDSEIVHNRIHALDLRWHPQLDVLKKVNPVGDRSSSVGPGIGIARRWTKRAEDVAFAATAVVDLLFGPLRRLGASIFLLLDRWTNQLRLSRTSRERPYI